MRRSRCGRFPFILSPARFVWICGMRWGFQGADEKINRYKVGGTFYAVPLEEAKEMLVTATEEADGEIEGLEEQVAVVREEMNKLKAELYARFGRGINLEA